MQLFQARHPIPDPLTLHHGELVSSQLLKDVHGEVLLISSGQTTICRRSAGNLRQRALSWLNIVANARSSRYIAGRVSEKGGMFRVVTREQALDLMTRWLAEALQNSES